MSYEFSIGNKKIFSLENLGIENTETPSNEELLIMKNVFGHVFQLGEEYYVLKAKDKNQCSDITKLVDLVLKENPTSMREFDLVLKNLVAKGDVSFNIKKTEWVFNKIFPFKDISQTITKEVVPSEKVENLRANVLKLAEEYDFLVINKASGEKIKEKKDALERSMDAFRKEFPKEFCELAIPYHCIELKLGEGSIFINKVLPEEFRSPVLGKFFSVEMKELKQKVKSIDLGKYVLSDVLPKVGDAESERVVLQAFADYLDRGVVPDLKDWPFMQTLSLLYMTDALFPGKNPIFPDPSFVERLHTVESHFSPVIQLAKELHVLEANKAQPEEIKQKREALAKGMDEFRQEFPKEFYQLAIPYHSIEIKLGKNAIIFNKASPEEFRSPVLGKFFTMGMKESKQEVKTIDAAKYILSDILSAEGGVESGDVILQAFSDYLERGAVSEFKDWSSKQILALFYIAQAFFPDDNDPLLNKLLTVDLGSMVGQGLARDEVFSKQIRSLRFSNSPFYFQEYPINKEKENASKQEFLDLIPRNPKWKSLDFSGLEPRELDSKSFVDDDFLIGVTDHCSDLHSINLSNSVITNKGLQALAKKSPGYLSINLSRCEAITDEGLMALVASSPNLSVINLYGCKNITDEGIKFLAKMCPKLADINLANCKKVTEKSISEIAVNCPDLISIDLRFNKNIIGSNGLSDLTSKCLKLKKINLTFCDISDSVIESIPENCSQVTSINLNSNSKLTDKGLQALVEKFPDLESIDLTWCERITNDGIKILGEKCKGLKEFKMNHCEKIDDRGLNYIANNCPALTLLEVSECGISGDGLETFTKSCPHLTSVDLRSCKNIDDDGLKALAKYCPELSSIVLYNCEDISNEGLIILAKGCKKLKKVDIGQCRQIKEFAIGILLKECPDLEYLNIIDCNQAGRKWNELKDVIQNQYPHVKV